MGDFRATDAMEPLVFAILAARTPKHIQIAFYDERLEPLPLNEATDLVAITVETFTARRAYQIADHYRSQGIAVIMGGYHPTLLPQECAPHADALVCGDAEGLWEQIISDVQNNRLKPMYRHHGETPMDGPLPDRTLFQNKKYAPIALVQFGRGCRFNCDFCSIHAFYGKRVFQRPLDLLVEEIRSLNTRHVFFVDDNLFSNVEKASAFCRAIMPLKIRWVCQVSIDVARHEPLLELMQQSGCFLALIGFESLQEKNLKQMHKKWNIKRDYSDAINKLQQHNIMVYGTFIFGYDYDAPDAFDATLDFALTHRLFLANFNPLMPTPGTELYERLQQEGRLRYPNWWIDPNYRYGNAMIEPKNMSCDELSRGCLRIRRRFYATHSILKRSTKMPRAFYKPFSLGLYFLSNFVSRREINNKQNKALGGQVQVKLPAAVNGHQSQ